ncbi:hypothetical protein J3A84_14630 [Proteiniclasticum sp. SCR006]|uniref:DUF2178 domain-containing protein n=1 Tax=Proteiniclasticum aestuarii TaxID=2817862 RepID=A0A939HEW7_9CLOT|nr:hypothetical protein [Proteiniclasticum aestuarii]MBO1266270.1 hypothetical protein [Proteiniclasticum aestuarii]
MENYKRTIRHRIGLFTGLILLTAVLGVYSSIAMGNPENTGISDGALSGFQMGLIVGLGVLALTQLFKLSMAVKDERKLKLAYNRENDERMKAIRAKAGMPMLLITSVLMIIAAIIAGYFNIVVFYTLTAAAVVQLLLGVSVKLYHMKTM